MLSGNVRGKPSPLQRYVKRKQPTDHSLEYDPAKVLGGVMESFADVPNGVNKTIGFTLAVNPDHIPTAQQKGIRRRRRSGKVVVFTKTHIRNWERLLTKALKPISGKTSGYNEKSGVAVSIDFRFPYTKDDLAEIKRHGRDGITMHVRPDVDNLAKNTLDAIVRSGLLVDDGNVYALNLKKTRGEEPCVIVSITVNYSSEKDNKHKGFGGGR